MFLIKLAWVKVLGALYLAWLSVKYFIDKRKGNAEEEEAHGMNQNSVLSECLVSSGEQLRWLN